MGIAKNTGPKVMAVSIPCAWNAFVQPILTNPMNKITAPAKYGQNALPGTRRAARGCARAPKANFIVPKSHKRSGDLQPPPILTGELGGFRRI